MRVSLEKLYHYRCDSSPNHWWSVADIEPKMGAEVFCPHCGTKCVVEGVDEPPVVDKKNTPIGLTIEEVSTGLAKLSKVGVFRNRDFPKMY